MFFSSWLRKRHPIQRQTRAAVPRRFRPAMEPLEDRSVPAVLNFMTTLGVIAPPQIPSSAGAPGELFIPPNPVVPPDLGVALQQAVDLVGVIAPPQIPSSAGSTAVDLVGVIAPPQIASSAGSTAVDLVGVIAPPQIPSSAGAPGELFIPPNPIVPPGLLVDLQRVDFAPGDPFIPPNPVVPPDLLVALQQAVDLVGVIAPPQIASSAGSTALDLVGVIALPQMTLSAGSTAFEQGQFTNLGQPLTTSVGLDQLSELSELQSLRLQMAMDRTNVLLTTLSNLEGLMANTAQSIVGNLK